LLTRPARVVGGPIAKIFRPEQVSLAMTIWAAYATCNVGGVFNWDETVGRLVRPDFRAARLRWDGGHGRSRHGADPDRIWHHGRRQRDVDY